MENSDDLALEALISVSTQFTPDLDIELLRRCYAIQKKHQFTPDRTQSTSAMDRLIEEQVNVLMSS